MAPKRDNNQEKVVRLQDIAERCGVDKTTVGRALRGDLRFASQATADRIAKVAAEMGYDPARNQAARRLSLMKNGQNAQSHMVALFVPAFGFFYPYYQEMFRSIAEVLWGHRYIIIVHYWYADRHPVPHAFARGDIDGALVIVPVKERVDIIRRDLRLEQKPIVTILNPAEGASSIIVDDYAGAYGLASNLIDLGHRRLMHFAGRGGENVRRRKNGYMQACIDRGLDPRKVLIQKAWSYDDAAFNERECLATLTANPEITGVLAINDRAAIWIINRLRKLGVMVPADVSVVGFDDTEVLRDEHENNILTTVRVPIERVGAEAATFLMRRLSGEVESDQTIVVPTELVLRATTAPPGRQTRESN